MIRETAYSGGLFVYRKVVNIIENNSVWCVYIHTSPSGKRYIGITSQQVKDRWRNGKGYKFNTYFGKAIKKYGWDNIKHEVVAEGLSEQDAKQMEIDLIQKYQSTDKTKGYNISLGGDGTKGVSHYGETNPFYGKHHSEESKAIIGDVLKKTWASGVLDDIICRPIYQFDLNGNFVKAYKSVTEAENETGIYHSVICRVCNKKLNYTHGFTWAYQDECSDFELFKNEFLNKIKAKKRNHAKSLRKAVNLFDLSENLLGVFESASQLAREIGVHKDTISYACRKNSILQGKYKCQYVKGEC